MSQNTKQVIVKIGATKLKYQIPTNWSINKLKCLLTSQVPSLDFDEFEICYNQKLLRGNYKIKEIFNREHIMEQLQLEIIKTKSQIKFNQYYKSSVGKFMDMSAHNKQPILSVDYQKYRTLVATANKEEPNQNNNIANLNDNAFADVQDQGNDAANNNPARHLFRILRLVGTYLILVLIYDHGKAHQIALILSVVLLYFGIQMFVKYKQRKLHRNNGRNNRQNNPQNNQNALQNDLQKQERKKQSMFKGLAVLYFYRSIQFIFCFFMTFFPNLSIQMHLQLNRERIERARAKINQYLPDSYPKQVIENRNR